MANRTNRAGVQGSAARKSSKGPWIAGVVALIALAAVAGLALGGRLAPLPASGDVSNAQAEALIKRGARIVDVRTPEEFAAAHIPGAENVPVDAVLAQAQAWDKGEAVLLYCATGERSAWAFQQLEQAGFEHLYNLKDGIVAWDGDVTSGAATRTAQGLQPLPSGLPALYEFYTDW